MNILSNKDEHEVNGSGWKNGVENLGYQREEYYRTPTVIFGSIDQLEANKCVKVRNIDLIEKEIKAESRKVWKSLIFFWLSLTLAFACTMTLISSITSLLSEGNVGVKTLTITTATQTIGTGILAPVVSKMWGPRRILQISLSITTFFAVYFFYPKTEMMIIVGIIFGIGQSLMVSTSNMYVNTIGYWYIHLKKIENVDSILVRFSCIVNCALGGGIFWGNLALYFILDTKPSEVGTTSNNSCGPHYCNQDFVTDITHPPTPGRYYALTGLFTALSVLGFGVFFLTEDFSSRLGHEKCSNAEAWTTLKKTWLLLKNPRVFLLFPMSVVIGMEQAFLAGDVTKAFVSCSLSISMVGLMMMVSGSTQIPVALGSSTLVKKFGSCCIVGVAVVIFLGASTTMLQWNPNPNQKVIYLVLFSCWAIGDALMMSVVNSTYAALFKDNLEGAFSLAAFWWSCGLLFWFSWSQFVCMYVKLYFLIVCFIISFALYVVLRLVILCKKYV